MQSVIAFVLFVAVVGWLFNRDRKPLDPAVQKLVNEAVKAKAIEDAPKRRKWLWAAAIGLIALFGFIAWQQNKSSQDFQNSLDYTTCRSDMRKGLSTAAECEQVQGNNWVYILK